jgi:N utilization substance protein A
VTELSAGVLQKLVAAGITTVEGLADMTPEQLEEIPGIGEKTLEKISLAVRNYFGQFEEGEAGRAPSAKDAEAAEAVVSGEENDTIPATSEAAIEDIPPAAEAEAATSQDQPAAAPEQSAQDAEEPQQQEKQTESATTDEQADKEGGA